MMNGWSFSAMTAAFLLLSPGVANACACCTNPGQRYVATEKLQQHRLDTIREIKFAGAAELFHGESDLADIKGIANPSGRYEIETAQQKDRFVFSFRDAKKNTGTLTLVLSDAISIFEIDPRDPSAKTNGLGPTLYKEWRLTAPFSGSGIFKAGNGGYQRITLILQGRGLGCTDATHFDRWTLVIHGPLGNYHFFGDLQKN